MNFTLILNEIFLQNVYIYLDYSCELLIKNIRHFRKSFIKMTSDTTKFMKINIMGDL